LQHFRAASSEHPATNFNSMIQLRMIQDLHHRADGPSFWIVRAIDQALDAGMHHRTGTHGARFNCNKQLTLAQTMVTNGFTRFTQRDDLGMRCRIRINNVTIPSASDDAPFAHNDCPYGHFSDFERALGTPKRLLHPEFVARIA